MRKKLKTSLFFLLLPIWGICQSLPIRIDSAEQIRFMLQDTLPVVIERLAGQINSPYSEYNGYLDADSTFFFSSLRPETVEDCESLFEPFWSTKIYASKLTVSGYSTPKPLPVVVNSTQYYNCNFTFSRDRSLLYFSRCLRAADKADLQCEIWGTENRNGKWAKPKRLTRKINLPGATATQPHLVEYEDCHLLFFVSDRPYGFGGLDIWYSIYKNGRFGDPINLGSFVNTPGNEATPFYDMEAKNLYFSSTGHLCLGGYDIFVSHGEFSDWSAAENMGVPYNSPYHDLYFSLNRAEPDCGFFASNRPIAESGGRDTCCHDLYAFCRPPQQEDTVAVDTVDLQADTIPREAIIRSIVPLTLYFHNDEPNPKSWDTTTNRNYSTTLADYLELKDTYQKEYSKGLKGKAKMEAEQAIERFFKDSLEQGFKKLETLVSCLLSDLQQGKTVEITIAGFASPLHKADYNLALSSRRIASLKNYLWDYDGGVFRPYLAANAKPRLIIYASPKGHSMAHKYVSDNVNDKRNSVYSIAASLERKIQITQYETR